MKKLFTTLNSLLVAAAMLLSGCSYDDSGLLSELDKVKGDVSDLQTDLGELADRVAALEANLANEVEALKAMVEALDAELAEKVVVSNCVTADNGDVTVTLSDGKSFTVYAEPEHTAVTVYTENGVQYWATVDANGAVVPVRDADGNLIPVVPVKEEKEEAILPQFSKSEDGSKVVVSFDGGLTWQETGAATTEALDKVSVFSGVEFVKVENAYGAEVVYQAKFTLADGSTFSVDLDPVFNEMYYQTFGTQFQIIDGYSGGQVTSLYVPAGGEDALQSVSGNVVDFLIEKPAGWKVVPEDMRSEGEPEAYWVFTVKAPSQEALDAGIAEEGGTVKIVAITGSGKVIPASVEVSANPLKSVSVSGGNISVQTYGSTTYVCGLTPYSAYSEEALSAAVAKMYDYMDWTWTWPEELGVNLEYAGNLEASISDLLGAAQDQSYVFWITFPEQDYESGAIKVDKFTKVVAPYVSVSVLEPLAGDAKVSIVMDTTDKFFAATLLPENYGQDAATQLENHLGNLAFFYAEDYNTTLPYEGKISDLTLFTKQTMAPGTTYVLAVLPYDAEKLANNSYTVADAVMVEFTTATPSVKDATLAKATISDVKEGVSKVSAKMTKDVGASFYYAWVDDATMSTLVSEADQLAYLLTNGKKYTYGSTTQSYTLPSGQTSVTLLVVPFSADWTYGDIVAQKMSVQPLVYNDIVVTINKVELTNGSGHYTADHTAANPYYYGYKVEFSATGGTAVDYKVYLADTSANYPYIKYFGSSVEGAIAYLADNPTSYFASTSGATTYENSGTKIVKYKSVNSVPTTEDLEYKLIVVAVDADGKYSKPASYSVYYKDFPVPAAN